MIVVKNIDCLGSGTARKLTCRVVHEKMPQTLYFESESNLPIADHDGSADAFLLGLIWPAMVLGEDLNIEGSVSEELLYSVNTPLQALLKSHDPSLKKIIVSAEGTMPVSDFQAGAVATGFSGGIDTFATLKLYSNNNVPGIGGVNILTTFNVGALGNTIESAALFERYSNRTKAFAQHTSRSWVNVNSNLDDFYKFSSCNFERNHTIRNIAAAFSLKNVITDYLYSSSFYYKWINCFRGGIAYVDPLLLPMLSLRSLRLHSAGAHLSRLEKTLLVSDYEPSFNLLDVCTGNPESRARREYVNCGRCLKCARALIALDAVDKLENFKYSFDLGAFRLHEPHAYAVTLSSALEGAPNSEDLLNFLHQRGLSSKLNPSIQLKCYITHYYKMIRRATRAALRRA